MAKETSVFPRQIIKKLSDTLFEIPQTGSMRVPAHIYVSEDMLAKVDDKALFQISNVAVLPGIVKAAMAMPDVHCGYGFPIGGVAAFDINDGGIITPGGIGYDINCGVRLMQTNIHSSDIQKYLPELLKELSTRVPSGVGKDSEFKVKGKVLNDILLNGASEMSKLGFGVTSDWLSCESHGCMSGAEPRAVSFEAKNRGANQLGTLGAGNHFLEIQKIEEIYDENMAEEYGLKKDMVTVMIHCGSRGLGHQTCKDYVQLMKFRKEIVPDIELAYAPFLSETGQLYFSAMNAAANFAFANRFLIAHHVREAFVKVFGVSTIVDTVYDISHNMGKLEGHKVDGEDKKLIVHRKGATRAFTGILNDKPHPVLVPGSMGTASYVLHGTQMGMDTTFGSVCHGAGRAMSRSQAKNRLNPKEVSKELEDKNILVSCNHAHELCEEAPQAYKDIENVMEVVTKAGLASKVAKLVPLGVIKG